MRVLVVEDSKLELLVLKNALVEGGYEVETAHNGVEALEVLSRGQCRLVITDWEMPAMDGITLCRAIRAQDLLGYVYVVLLTGHGSAEEKVAGLTAGAD